MTVKLLLCFLPLAIIWIVMKISVWMFAVNDEKNYVKAESRKPHGPYLADAYADVDAEEEESMEIAQTIDKALYQYYVVERGEDVPNWRYIKDQDWWIEYLDSLGIPRRNP